MTLLYSRNAGKNKAELLDEIARLENDLKSKNNEISILKKKLQIYKSLK